ncbi:hypothetical protein BDV09DRAFT_158364, partial [Aspergillus tetrazonus]
MHPFCRLSRFILLSFCLESTSGPHNSVSDTKRRICRLYLVIPLPRSESIRSSLWCCYEPSVIYYLSIQLLAKRMSVFADGRRDNSAWSSIITGSKYLIASDNWTDLQSIKPCHEHF